MYTAVKFQNISQFIHYLPAVWSWWRITCVFWKQEKIKQCDVIELFVKKCPMQTDIYKEMVNVLGDAGSFRDNGLYIHTQVWMCLYMIPKTNLKHCKQFQESCSKTSGWGRISFLRLLPWACVSCFSSTAWYMQKLCARWVTHLLSSDKKSSWKRTFYRSSKITV